MELMTRGRKMDKVIHPVSGEHGYFCTETEKSLIDAVLKDFVVSQLVVTSTDSRGVVE